MPQGSFFSIQSSTIRLIIEEQTIEINATKQNLTFDIIYNNNYNNNS